MIHYAMIMSLHLLAVITSVRVVYTLNGMMGLDSTLMMSSGMVRAVQLTAHAVSSTTLHGLQSTCPMPQQITLN